MTASAHATAIVSQFLQETRDALSLLGTEMKAANDAAASGVRRVFDSRGFHERDPREVAGGTAAKAIFEAEGKYSGACIELLAGSSSEAAVVIELRTAGDAILRFAASAFVELVGSHHISDYNAQKLQKLKDCVGTGNASDGNSAIRALIAPSPSGPISPRMGPRM